jgi:hypothetical protein
VKLRTIRTEQQFAAAHDRLLDPPDDDGTSECEVCEGSGKVDGDTCETCNGCGRIDEEGNPAVPALASDDYFGDDE